MSEQIKTSVEHGVFAVVIDRREKMNALNAAMYGALADAFREAASNPDIAAVVIRGGEHFTAGYDLADLLENPPQDESSAVFRFMSALSECPLPVIAMVEGAAVGIGVTLLLHCDFVYATPEAEFMMPFVSLGAVPEFAATQILPLRAGYLKAAEMLLLGDRFDSSTALSVGIVTAIVERDELDAAVRGCVEKLASKPRDSIIETKALMKRELEPLAARMRAEAKVFLKGIRSPQAQRILRAFLNR